MKPDMINMDAETKGSKQRRRHKHLGVVALMVALLALAPAAEAIIVDWMPVFGVVNGLDVARLNVALADLPPGPCRVSLAFFNGNGNMIGDPNQFTLQGVEGVFIDFIGDPGIRPGTRVRLRARVTLADPQEFPGCAVGARISLEVFDRVTRATRFIITDTIMGPQPHL
jgi:hypothetical protein